MISCIFAFSCSYHWSDTKLILILPIRRQNSTSFLWGSLCKTLPQKDKNVTFSVFLVPAIDIAQHGFALTNLQIDGLYLPRWFHFEYGRDWIATGGHHVVAAIPETPKFPDFAAELSFRHDCAADQCDVGVRSKISYNICPSNNRKGVHTKIKLFVAAWTPTFAGMMVARRNSFPSCAVGESPLPRGEPSCCDSPARRQAFPTYRDEFISFSSRMRGRTFLRCDDGCCSSSLCRISCGDGGAETA